VPANECIPYYEGPYTQVLTVHAGYAVTGKTFVGPITTYQGAGPGLAADPLPAGDGGDLQCPAAPAAGGQTGGVAAWDVSSGSKVPVLRGVGTFLPVTSGAAVASGDLLKVDVQGRVVPAAQVAAGAQPNQWIVGKAHSVAGAAGVDVVVELLSPFVY
jgi:hypothetical protein